MNRNYPADCERRQPRIKRRWTDALQIEPGWQDLESNADLLALMDQVLVELWAILRSPSVARWLGRPDHILLPEWNPGRCGLGLLIPFLAAGKTALLEEWERVEEALREPAAGGGNPARRVLERRRRELTLCFDIVAQREIERVCRSCRISLDCPFAGRSHCRN